MSYRLLKIEEVVGGLTEATLTALEELPAIRGERPLAKARLKRHEQWLKEGDFNRCEWATCRCKEDGIVYRVNGQHSSHQLRRVLIGEIEAEFPEGVPVNIMRFECDLISDLPMIFDQFDSQVTSRTAFDKLGIFMAQYDDLKGVETKFCNQILASVAWGLNNHCRLIEEACFESDRLGLSAYQRGLLLQYEAVRDFIGDMMERRDGSFDVWKSKSGIGARFFELWLEDREQGLLTIDAIVYEQGDVKTNDLLQKLRVQATRKGFEPGHYYRATAKVVNAMRSYIDKEGIDAVKQMIKEVMEEQSVEA